MWALGNAGRGSWLVGYNTFYDNFAGRNLQRAGFGAEAWGEYLRPSANFISRLLHGMNRQPRRNNGWRAGTTRQPEMRMPFYQHLNTSVSVEQYFG
ncbi:hypothetical protein DMI65_23605 [Escherichia coli]|nr:hypothetical protein [Escherichia coli]